MTSFQPARDSAKTSTRPGEQTNILTPALSSIQRYLKERERERRNERDKRDKMFEYIGFYLISYFLLSSN